MSDTRGKIIFIHFLCVTMVARPIRNAATYLGIRSVTLSLNTTILILSISI